MYLVMGHDDTVNRPAIKEACNGNQLYGLLQNPDLRKITKSNAAPHMNYM
jgi:hypothetical protein